MNKKIITLAVVAVAVVAMGVALFALNRMPADSGFIEQSAVEERALDYVTGGPESIRPEKIVVENDKGGYVINIENADAERKLDVKYFIQGIEDFEPQRALLIGVSDYCEKIAATSIVADKADNLSIYGLAAPRATVAIDYVDGSKATFIVGDNAPGDNVAYVKRLDRDTVYAVQVSIIERFLTKPADFFGKTVSYGDPQNTMILRALLGGTMRDREIEIIDIEKTPDDVSDYVLSTHEIIKPINTGINSGRGLAALHSSFGITAEEVVDVAISDEILEKYDLLEPYSTILIVPQDPDAETFSLSSTAPDKDGYVLMLKDRLIYKVNADGLTWINIQLHDLIMPNVILPYLDAVSEIIIASPEKTTTFTVEGKENEIRIFSDGLGMDNDSFRQYYQTLISAEYAEPADVELTEKTEPLLSITYKYKSGAPQDTVYFYASNAPRKVYVSKDDEPVIYYTSTGYFDRVVLDLEKIIAGEPVKAI